MHDRPIYGVIVAARTGSSRLPRKALLPLMGMPMIVFLIRRILAARLADKIIFATTTLAEDDELASIVAAEGIPVFRGANDDVVGRFVETAHAHNLDYVVRVTGDCPFVDAETLDYCLAQCRDFGAFDLASTKKLFPIGIDYEVYRASTMAKLHGSDDLNVEDREHLTKYLYDRAADFDIRPLPPLPQWDRHDFVYTIDTPEDYRFAQRIAAQFDTIYFSVESLLKASEDAQ